MKTRSIKAEMVEALANAFDKAATTQATKWHAAAAIIADLRQAGFVIEPVKTAQAKRNAA